MHDYTDYATARRAVRNEEIFAEIDAERETLVKIAFAAGAVFGIVAVIFLALITGVV